MTLRYGSFETALAERYRFEEELGRGAMGVVYRAQDVRIGRPVAIKMLHPMLTNELGIKRFESEIRIAAGLHHANIVGLHEAGEAEGRLFYVMDYLGGETLRQRLQREKQLSVDEALTIADQVGAALHYAHEHGVVHRDVKPENIILAEGRACVVDFGLARALNEIEAERLTMSGISVGTPQYLSPEQASAEREVGPRADQYALACVVYEMLIGEPPFTGPTASSIAMRHIAETPPPMHTRRKSTPSSIEKAVMKALEKVPADRWADLQEFVGALRETSIASLPPATRRLTSRIAVGVALLLALSVGAAMFFARDFGLSSDTPVARNAAAPLDSVRIGVSAFERGGAEPLALDVDQAFTDALRSWADLTIVAAASLRTGPFSRDYSITGNAWHDGAGVHVQAQLANVRGGSTTRANALIAPGASADSALKALAVALLFNQPPSARAEHVARFTHSYRAARRYLDGSAHLARWSLVNAESAFVQSSRADPNFLYPVLGIAELHALEANNAAMADWAKRALRDTTGLSLNDRLLAEGISELGAGNNHGACLRFDRVVNADPQSLSGWHGVSLCNQRDKIVVRSAASPSGMIFRGSIRRSIDAQEHFWSLVSDVDVCCERFPIAQLREVYRYASSTAVRFGPLESDRAASYGAYPQLDHDTIAFVPIPARRLIEPAPSTHLLAVQQQRRQFVDAVMRHVARTKHGVVTLELIADALELSGDPAAIDTLRRTRDLSTDVNQRARLGAREVWMRIKYALPDNLVELRCAKVLAESLLAMPVNRSENAADLASLAAILGQTNTAARLAAQRARLELSPVPMPVELMAAAQALLVFAAAGGPADSLRILEARFEADLRGGVIGQQQSQVRTMYVSRAAVLAFPTFRFSNLARLDTAGDYLLSAEVAYAANQGKRALAILDAARKTRTAYSTADFSFDALYPEASLRAAMADSTTAIEDLSTTLGAIRAVPTSILSDPVVATSLVRSIRLLADLQSHRDASAARQWRAVLTALTGQ